ncbi:MAG: hypothetical protein ABIJ42_00835 [Acidobacteriota bacterium]
MEKHMRYQVRVAGRIFEGSDVNTLLKCAVQARREKLRDEGTSANTAPITSGRLDQRPISSQRQMTAA